MFEASPNPASESLSVRFDYPASELAELSLNDVTGRSVASLRLEAAAGSNAVQFDLSALPSGTYLLSLRGVFGRATQLVVKR